MRLLVQVQGEAQARRIDPPVADLAQAPYSRVLRQGVCDPGQALRIRDTSKTVPLLDEPDPVALRSDRDILVAVEDDLRAERRMPGHLDRQVPPPGVHDVEAVVIHMRGLLGNGADDPAIGGAAHVPHRGRGPGDQDQEHPRADRMRPEVLLGDQVLAFPAGAVDHRDAAGRGKGPHPPGEPARQPHQMGVVQFVVGIVVQPPPPDPEPARTVTQRVIRVQHDPVHAVIRTGQQVPVPVGELISHPADRKAQAHTASAGLPEGAIPSGRSPGRNVGACIPPIDKMLSMRRMAAFRCRRAGTGSACRCGGSRSRGRRRSRSWACGPCGGCALRPGSAR